MSFIDEITMTPGRITLSSNSETRQVGSPKVISKTADNQKINVVRVEKAKIREVCMQDSISFNMLNIYTNTIMKAGYKYVGDSKEYEKLFEEMMFRGEKSSMRRIKKEILNDRAKYGAGFIEIIPYVKKNGEEYGVADLRRINASRIDYIRDKNGNIIFDEEGIPFGFVMNFSANSKGLPSGDVVPKKLRDLGFTLQRGQVYLSKKRVAVFPLYRLDNGYDFIGLIEPAYQDITDRLQAMRIQINALKIKATSLPVVKVGDSNHEPTLDQMNDAAKIISGLKEAIGLAIPYSMDVGTIKFDALDILNDAIKMLLSSSATASGAPLALISGSGESTNRATLASQIESMIAMLQAQVEDFVEDWNIQIINRIKVENGFKGNCKLVWNGIRYEDKQEDRKLILESAKIGKITTKEYRRWLRTTNIIELDQDSEFEKDFGNFINLPNQYTYFGKNNGNIIENNSKEQTEETKKIEVGKKNPNLQKKE